MENVYFSLTLFWFTGKFAGNPYGFPLVFEAVYTGGSFSSKGGGVMRTLQALAQKVGPRLDQFSQLLGGSPTRPPLP